MNTKEILKTPKGEHTINGIKALIAAIPVAGGSLNSLMNDYLPNYKLNRLIKFVEELSDKFEEHSSNINDEYITSEEFGYLFEETMKKVSIEHREEKLKAYKNFLIKSMIDLSIEDEKKEYFLGFIDRLTYYHLVILKIFYSPEIVIKQFNINTSNFEQSLGGIFKPLIGPYNIPTHIWENLLKEVEQMGLIKNVSSGLNTMMSRANFNTLKERQSEFGKEFYSFIKDSESQ